MIFDYEKAEVDELVYVLLPIVAKLRHYACTWSLLVY